MTASAVALSPAHAARQVEQERRLAELRGLSALLARGQTLLAAFGPGWTPTDPVDLAAHQYALAVAAERSTPR